MAKTREYSTKSTARKGLDVYYAYQFVKRITTPWEEWEAYKLGLIDKKGKRLRKPKTQRERDSITFFDRLIMNLKRILTKIGAKSKFSSYAAAILLLREGEKLMDMSDYEIERKILQEEKILLKNSGRSVTDLMSEDAPTNATGAGVVGTGDNVVHWRAPAHPTNRRKRHKIDGLAFLRRQKAKEAKDQLTAAEKMIKKAKEQAHA